MILNVDPIAKPRMTRRDKWQERPCVMRYRAFADEVRRQADQPLPDVLRVTFWLPMPKSWSKKRRKEMANQVHQQKPDLDNLCKALMDALSKDDAHVYRIEAEKRWGNTGIIHVQT